MIVVWDNGGEYSDHFIHFVDIGDVSLDDAQFLMNDERGASIIACGWLLFAGEPETLRDWVHRTLRLMHPPKCGVGKNFVGTQDACTCALRSRVDMAKRLGLLDGDES